MQVRHDVDMIFYAADLIEVTFFICQYSADVFVKIGAFFFCKCSLSIFGAKYNLIDNLGIGAHTTFKPFRLVLTLLFVLLMLKSFGLWVTVSNLKISFDSRNGFFRKDEVIAPLADLF